MFSSLVVFTTHSHVLCVFAEFPAPNQSNICTNWHFNSIAAQIPIPNIPVKKSVREKIVQRPNERDQKLCANLAVSPTARAFVVFYCKISPSIQDSTSFRKQQKESQQNICKIQRYHHDGDGWSSFFSQARYFVRFSVVSFIR